MWTGAKARRVSVCLFAGIALSCLFILSDFDRRALAASEKPAEADSNKLAVLNLYGRVVGSVDKAGNVYNRYGKLLGSVDSGGTIFNVSKIPVGKIGPNGKLFNQAETYLGLVDADGNVFNVSGRKVGSVSPGGDIILTGAAARLLLHRSGKH